MSRPRHQVSPLAPRSAVVTGGARGIGRALCVELVEQGYQVVVADVDGAAAARTAAAVDACDSLAHDVRDEGTHADVVALARRHAPLGAWVNNAGVGFEGTTADQESDRVRALVEVNLLGAIWGSRAAVAAYREQAEEGIKGGELAFTASLSAHGPVPGLSVYAATKAAVLSLATSLASELRAERIRVHAVCPDGVQTALLDQMADDSQAKALIRSGTLLQPEDVAAALVGLFGTRRVYRTLPAWRGALMRTGGAWPTMMRLEPVMRRLGQRRLRG